MAPRVHPVSILVFLVGLALGITGLTLAIVFGVKNSGNGNSCPPTTPPPSCPQTTCDAKLFTIRTGLTQETLTWDAPLANTSSPEFISNATRISKMLSASLQSSVSTSSSAAFQSSEAAAASTPYDYVVSVTRFAQAADGTVVAFAAGAATGDQKIIASLPNTLENNVQQTLANDTQVATDPIVNYDAMTFCSGGPDTNYNNASPSPSTTCDCPSPAPCTSPEPCNCPSPQPSSTCPPVTECAPCSTATVPTSCPTCATPTVCPAINASTCAPFVTSSTTLSPSSCPSPPPCPSVTPPANCATNCPPIDATTCAPFVSGPTCPTIPSGTNCPPIDATTCAPFASGPTCPTLSETTCAPCPSCSTPSPIYPTDCPPIDKTTCAPFTSASCPPCPTSAITCPTLSAGTSSGQCPTPICDETTCSPFISTSCPELPTVPSCPASGETCPPCPTSTSTAASCPPCSTTPLWTGTTTEGTSTMTGSTGSSGTTTPAGSTTEVSSPSESTESTEIPLTTEMETTLPTTSPCYGKKYFYGDIAIVLEHSKAPDARSQNAQNVMINTFITLQLLKYDGYLVDGVTTRLLAAPYPQTSDYSFLPISYGNGPVTLDSFNNTLQAIDYYPVISSDATVKEGLQFVLQAPDHDRFGAVVIVGISSAFVDDAKDSSAQLQQKGYHVFTVTLNGTGDLGPLASDPSFAFQLTNPQNPNAAENIANSIGNELLSQSSVCIGGTPPTSPPPTTTGLPTTTEVPTTTTKGCPKKFLTNDIAYVFENAAATIALSNLTANFLSSALIPKAMTDLRGSKTWNNNSNFALVGYPQSAQYSKVLGCCDFGLVHQNDYSIHLQTMIIAANGFPQIPTTDASMNEGLSYANTEFTALSDGRKLSIVLFVNSDIGVANAMATATSLKNAGNAVVTVAVGGQFDLSSIASENFVHYLNATTDKDSLAREIVTDLVTQGTVCCDENALNCS